MKGFILGRNRFDGGGGVKIRKAVVRRFCMLIRLELDKSSFCKFSLISESTSEVRVNTIF